MKFIPKLFKTDMVRAIQNKIKTKTRRTDGLELVNGTPDKFRYISNSYETDIPHEAIKYDDRIYYLFNTHWSNAVSYVVRCPYKKGDVLWVRETFYSTMNDDFEKDFVYLADCITKRPFDLSDAYCMNEWGSRNKDMWPKWKPSLFMPKEGCRIFLEITDVRVERLQDISEQDAISEGVEFREWPEGRYYKTYTESTNYFNENVAYTSFKTLWQSINGQDSWEVNPFVWVISFRRIEKPENFK